MDKSEKDKKKDSTGIMLGHQHGIKNFLRMVNSGMSHNIGVTLVQNKRLTKQFNCSMKFEATFKIDAEELMQVDDKKHPYPNVTGSFQISPNNKGKYSYCAPAIKGSLTLLKKNFYMKIAHYSLFVIAIAMINIVVAVRFITRMISGEIDPNKYSMLTMFLISGMD